MKNFVIGLAVGSIAGSGLTYILLKKTIQKKAEEQIESVKKAYENHDKKKKEISNEKSFRDADENVSATSGDVSSDEFVNGLTKIGAEHISVDECGLRDDYDVLDWCVFEDGYVCVDDVYKYIVDEDTVNCYLPDNWRDYIESDGDGENATCFRNYTEELDVSIVSYPISYKQWLLDNGYTSRYDEEFA